VLPAAAYFQCRKGGSRIIIKYKLNVKGGIKMAKKQKCEVYSRVVGYLSPVSEWNKGKKEEFKDRKTFKNSKN